VIKLTCLLKRNPSLSAEEFQEHWRTTHAALIRSVPGIERWLIRYEQRSPLDQRDGWTGTAEFDGVTEQWFGSYDDFVAMISDPGYREIVGADEPLLLDMGAIVCTITDDVRSIVDGEADR
jgi:uncharacterized protein (TIGR02118 family)